MASSFYLRWKCYLQITWESAQFVKALSIKSENQYRFQLLETRMYGGRNGFKQVLASKACHCDLQIDNANIEQLPHQGYGV